MFFNAILRLSILDVLVAKLHKYINYLIGFEKTTVRRSLLSFKFLYKNYIFLLSSLKIENSKNQLFNFNNFRNYLTFNSIISNLTVNGGLYFLNPILLQKYNDSLYFIKVNLNKFNSRKVEFIFSGLRNGLNYVNYLYNGTKMMTTVNHFVNNIENSVTVWSIKYSPSNFFKYVNLSNLNAYNILYLRKSKVFNKGRYSRNRQYYRTGVY